MTWNYNYMWFNRFILFILNICLKMYHATVTDTEYHYVTRMLYVVLCTCGPKRTNIYMLKYPYVLACVFSGPQLFFLVHLTQTRSRLPTV
jgi:hypothetical protein